MCEHEQSEKHDPHAMLIHAPPINASCGNGHDEPVKSYQSPTCGIHGPAGRQSFRHGRSDTEHRPNCSFVRFHSISVAIIAALASNSGVTSSGKFSHDKSHAWHGPKDAPPATAADSIGLITGMRPPYGVANLPAWTMIA